MQLLLAYLLTASPALPSSALIAEVIVRGAPPTLTLATKAGEPYLQTTIEKDIRKLHATGRFSDVRVESEDTSQGPRVVFNLVSSPRMTLRKVEVIPDRFPIKLPAISTTSINAARAQYLAREYRKQLIGAGYPDAQVRSDLVPVAPSRADVRLYVTPGRKMQIKEVRVRGDENDVGHRALRALKPGWLRSPSYSDEAVQADIARIQSAYISRGYVDAVVLLDHTSEVARDRIAVDLSVRPGRRYQTAGDLCKCIHNERREAEAEGVLDFSARASVDAEGVFRATTVRGPSYKIRRIDFEGNRRYSDSSIRRNLLITETETLNIGNLRKSLDRLNRTSMFEPLSEADVDVRTDDRSGQADLRIRLRERKFGSWMLSGPVGPVSIAGPLRFTLASRLPPWGEGLLDLSSYLASLHLSYNQIIFSFERPYMPGQSWPSGFAIAPQLGWKSMAAQYGGTQLQERLLRPGDSNAPAIPVVVERGFGETVMLCEPAPSRWRWTRRGVTMALQIGSMLM